MRAVDVPPSWPANHMSSTAFALPIHEVSTGLSLLITTIVFGFAAATALIRSTFAADIAVTAEIVWPSYGVPGRRRGGRARAAAGVDEDERLALADRGRGGGDVAAVRRREPDAADRTGETAERRVRTARSAASRSVVAS